MAQQKSKSKSKKSVAVSAIDPASNSTPVIDPTSIPDLVTVPDTIMNPAVQEPKLDLRLSQTVVNRWNDGDSIFLQYEVEVRNDTFKPVLNAFVKVTTSNIIRQAWNAERDGNVFYFPSQLVINGGIQPASSFKFGYIVDGPTPMLSFL